MTQREAISKAELLSFQKPYNEGFFITFLRDARAYALFSEIPEADFFQFGYLVVIYFRL